MEVPRKTVDELKALMDRNEQVTIIDVRQPAAYRTSPWKIKGAVYVDPDDEQALMAAVGSLDKSAPIVVY
ncbi:MAG: rhodanese-like domain-containing protein [Nitrospirota bacterium]